MGGGDAEGGGKIDCILTMYGIDGGNVVDVVAAADVPVSSLTRIVAEVDRKSLSVLSICSFSSNVMEDVTVETNCGAPLTSYCACSFT